MKVLVNCYACSPYRGSEPGMGWNFVSHLAQRHELNVICEAKFQTDIERYKLENPKAFDNLRFYYIAKKRHRTLRKLWPPSYYWFYHDWQKKAYEMGLRLEEDWHFDVVHQLNMVGYREPGLLWKMGKPFVWGPIGGFNITPWRLLPSMGAYGCVYYAFRNIINLMQMHTMPRVRKAMERADALIAATADTQRVIEKLYGRRSVIIPEVGMTDKSNAGKTYPTPSHEHLRICWSGQHTPGKSLNLLIHALGLCKEKVEVHVLGTGRCTEKWKRQAEDVGKNVRFIWYGWKEKSESISIMRECDVFCITSLSDLTSTVLLEALSYGLPVIALDHCGFSNVITNECGIKIPIKHEGQVVRDIAAAIERLATNETERKQMSVAAIQRAWQYNWEGKAAMIDKIYGEVVK